MAPGGPSAAGSNTGRQGRRFSGYAAAWPTPMLIWQTLFFIVPLCFLLVMSFWLVKNYRMTPGFDTINWTKMYSRGYFRDAYFFTFSMALLSTVVTSLAAFPASYAMAFKVSPAARRWIIFLLIIPFFTSYLVRAYAWQVILAEQGIINAMLSYIGLGPFTMLNTKFGTLVGYMTLSLPLVVILQTFSLASIDRNLVEAAHNLGCGRVRTVFTVILPLAKVGLIIGAVFCFILSFGDFVSPYYLGGSKPPTLSILIIDTTKSGQQWPRAAVVAVTMIVTLMVVAFAAVGAAYRKPGMTADRIIAWFLRGYIGLVLCFVFAPIIASFVFSFNSDRFPSIPLGHFTLHWYETIYNDPDVWEALRVSVIVALFTSVISTAIGFCTAYTDFRYRFTGKNVYLALALLPPTIPLVIMGLAMLAWLSRIGMSGHISSIIVAHVVLCTPFAMAIVRLRLQQMDPSLEAAAWNLGAGEWRAMREVIIPFSLPAIISALCLTAAVSFDEFAVAWFVSGLNKTIPVIILEVLQGNVDPQINAIGTFVFITSMTLVVIAQVLFMTRERKHQGDNV